MDDSINPKDLPPVSEPNLELHTEKSTKSEDNLVFYTIMPKSKNQDGLVQPTLKVEQKIEKIEENDLHKIFISYKKYFVYAFLAVILGIGFYFLILYIGKGSEESDIQLNIPVSPTGKSQSSSGDSILGFSTTQEWRDKYFPSCNEESLCGDQADPDHDGTINTKEFALNTDPNNTDSDQDGISDGDEVNIFNSNPLNIRTANDPQFTDADFIKGGYDLGTGKKMSAGQISSITNKMKQFGLHQPTVKTLFSVLNTIYNFTPDSTQDTAITTKPTTELPSNIDTSLEAKQDRDTQRSSTIKNIESALVKYQTDNKKYPVAADFGTMFAMIKPYLKVATNPNDPINIDPFIYTYISDKLGTDFTLSFFSEVANQIIKKHSVEAISDSNAEQAAVFDDQRKYDLESLQTALLLYSQKNVAGNQTYVFPAEDKYKTLLVPEDITQIPKDPKTRIDYEYKVSPTFDTFTLKAVFDKPTAGTTGWLCNQEECRSY